MALQSQQRRKLSSAEEFGLVVQFFDSLHFAPLHALPQSFAFAPFSQGKAYTHQFPHQPVVRTQNRRTTGMKLKESHNNRILIYLITQ